MKIECICVTISLWLDIVYKCTLFFFLCLRQQAGDFFICNLLKIDYFNKLITILIHFVTFFVFLMRF
nr:MAG TPA: hypothetical protein [Caudoviricetes sp.]